MDESLVTFFETQCIPNHYIANFNFNFNFTEVSATAFVFPGMILLTFICC